MRNKNTDWGIIVARYQVPHLPDEFKQKINEVKERHANVCVILGLSLLPSSIENPLNYGARKQMILQSYPDFEVGFIKDHKSDAQWVSNLDHIISTHVDNGQSATIYGSRDKVIRTYEKYNGRFNCEEFECESVISYKEICKDILTRPPYCDKWRAGVVWSQRTQYPKTHATVDIAIIERDEKVLYIYLGRKEGETKYRFIGGYSDPDSECYEDDAKREVKEETTLDVSDLKYVGSKKINDVRYRNEVDKIKTVFFTAKYQFGRAEARDDIVEVRRFKYCELSHDNIIQEHHCLYDMLVDELHD